VGACVLLGMCVWLLVADKGEEMRKMAGAGAQEWGTSDDLDQQVARQEDKDSNTTFKPTLLRLPFVDRHTHTHKCPAKCVSEGI
jgi:hypothetical protein